MRKPLRLLLVLVGTIALGYFFRSTFGREATYWLIGGLIAVAFVLKLLQFGLLRYVKTQEAKMSLEGRMEFEQFKKEHR
jgi:hypothetical protein